MVIMVTHRQLLVVVVVVVVEGREEPLQATRQSWGLLHQLVWLVREVTQYLAKVKPAEVLESRMGSWTACLKPG
jgi:hypothetical protein